MKNLILPASITPFDWNENEDNQKAYKAIISQGYTAEFKVAVWNSIVDKLNLTLASFGLIWDNKYTTIENAKLYGVYPNLTAKIFNSVRYNIEVHVPTTWKWQFDKTFTGYIGRNDFVGVSTTNEPDTVYGTYVEELVRKLNLLIAILKNDAPLINQQVRENLSLDTSRMILDSFSSRPLQIKYKSCFSDISQIEFTEPKKLVAKDAIKVKETGKLTAKYADDLMRSKVNSFTAYLAEITLEELYKNLYSYVFSKQNATARLRVNENISRLNALLINVQVADGRLSFADVVDFYTNAINFSFEIAELENVPTMLTSINYLSETDSKALVELCLRELIDVNVISQSRESGHLEIYAGSELYSSIMSILRQIKSSMNAARAGRLASRIEALLTIINPRMYARQAGIIPIANVPSEMILNNELLQFESLIIGNENIDHLNAIEASSNIKKSFPIDNIMLNHEQNGNAILEKKLIRQIATQHRIYKTDNAEVLSVMSKHSTANITNHSNVSSAWLEGYRNSNSIFVREQYIQKQMANLSSLFYDGECLQTNELLKTCNSSELSYRVPLDFSLSHIETETIAATSVLRIANDTAAINEVAFDNHVVANLEIVRFETIEGTTNEFSKIVCDLSHDPSSWRNPEQNGDELMIYQVYDINQSGSVLKLDCEEDL